MTEPKGTEKRGPVELISEYFRGKKLSQGFEIKAKVTPSRFVEQAYFAIHLLKDNSISSDAVFSGIFSAGRPSQAIAGWVDVDYFETASFTDASKVALGELNFDVELFKILGGLVPPGGSMMVSYTLFSKGSKVHRDTKTGLDRGYPPVLTPLGFLLFAAGCGMGFKDWYFAEGGREGPEKLQGFKPPNRQSADEKAEQMLQELQLFVSRPQPEDGLSQECMVRADLVIGELKRRN